MKIDINNQNHILAEEGMVFKRISDGFIHGEELYLGYTYYLGGELLETPLLELPEHFEEVEKPIENEIIENIDNSWKKI